MALSRDESDRAVRIVRIDTFSEQVCGDAERSRSTALLKVPAIGRETFNVPLNPAHDDAMRITIVESGEHAIAAVVSDTSDTMGGERSWCQTCQTPWLDVEYWSPDEHVASKWSSSSVVCYRRRLTT
jgi:hypothetical protein